MKVEFLGGNTKEEIERRIKIVASAGILSRFNGTVSQVIESRNDYEANLKLARKVIGYGHKSISEHDYLVFSIEDVTPIIEQIIISYRLTSFTIKSRRNVDFSRVGFYTPTFKDENGFPLSNNKELQDEYNKYMHFLFNQYEDLVKEGLPLEDCRYILPYSYHSNIIMGCDAHEFFNMTTDLLYGPNCKIGEVHELGEIFAGIIQNYIPYLSKALEQEKEKGKQEDNLAFLDVVTKNLDSLLLDKVQMIDYTENADLKVIISALMARYQCDYQTAQTLLFKMSETDESIKHEIMKIITRNKQQRELEQVIFSYQIPISLAALTHITRHRTHSLLIPSFTRFNLNHYVTPDTIALDHKKEYDEIFKGNKEMRESFAEKGVMSNDLVYFLLSGNACNITTTMDARTLEWISRARCCNKAQWEIRNIVNQMVILAREVAPLIGEELGPSCKVLGICPEGEDSCKQRGPVKMLKKPVNSTNNG